MGQLDDWVKLKEATENLAEYGLEWWVPNIVEVLNKLIQAYKGENDKAFWKFIYKYYSGGSGE